MASPSMETVDYTTSAEPVEDQSVLKKGGDERYLDVGNWAMVFVILVMVVAIVALLYALDAHKATSQSGFFGIAPCDYFFSQQVTSAAQALNSSAVATGRIIFDESATETQPCIWALAGGGTTATGFTALTNGYFNMQYSLRLRTTNTGATGGVVRTWLVKNNVAIDGSVVEKFGIPPTNGPAAGVGVNGGFEDTWVSPVVQVPVLCNDVIALLYEAGSATQNWATIADSVAGSGAAATFSADHLVNISCKNS